MTKVHVSCSDFFHSKISQLHINDNFNHLNAHLECDGSMEWFQQLVNINNGGHDSINIEWSKLRNLETSDFNKQALLVKMESIVIGFILIYWNKSDDVEHLDSMVFKRCTLVGGGEFIPHINLVNYNVEWNTFVPKVNSQYLGKYVFDISYDDNLKHDVGITVNDGKILWAGDHKHFYCLFGMAGSTANHSCPYCLTNRNEMWGHPTPANRCWQTRSETEIYQWWMECVGGQKRSSNKFGLNSNPILIAGPGSLALAVLHQMQGVGGRIWGIIQSEIRFGSPLANHFNDPEHETIASWNFKHNQRDELSGEIQQLEEALNFLQCKENHDIFHGEFVNSLSDKLDEFKTQITNKKKQLNDLNKELKCIENNLKKHNSQMIFLEMCDKLNVKPWHYKDQSMIGPSVKKYVNNYNIVIEYMNKFNPQCARIMEPCLARFRFICKCMWTKSKDSYSDECLNYLKFNIVEFDFLYHLLIEGYGGGMGHKYGVKWHGLYHGYSFIKFFGFAPAFVDEQRVEAFNIHIRKFLPIYHCFGGHVNMSKMMNKVWRHFLNCT